MAWKIRKEIKKHFPGIVFHVRSAGGDWYDIILKPFGPTIDDAKKWLQYRDEIYKRLYDFIIENEIILNVSC